MSPSLPEARNGRHAGRVDVSAGPARGIVLWFLPALALFVAVSFAVAALVAVIV